MVPVTASRESVETHSTHNPVGIRACLAADIALARRQREGRLLPYFFPSIFAVVMYRVAHALGRRRATIPARAVMIVAQLLTGAEIDWRAQIGPGLFLEHPVGVVVGDGVVAGSNLVLGAAALLGANSFYQSRTRPKVGFPTLGDDVFVFAKASIIGPVEVGDRAVIGAHALVLANVPADAVARGVPAKSYVDGQQLSKGLT